jgi:hypothetical protein
VKQRISKAAFFKTCRASRQRFSKLRVGKAGKVNVRAALPKDWHCVWFELNQVHEDDGTYYFDDDSYSVYMFVDGVLSVVFYLAAGVVESASFSVQLNAGQLSHAVHALQDAGLGRFVVPAAAQALQHAPESARKVLGTALRRLSRRPSRGRG